MLFVSRSEAICTVTSCSKQPQDGKRPILGLALHITFVLFLSQHLCLDACLQVQGLQPLDVLPVQYLLHHELINTFIIVFYYHIIIIYIIIIKYQSLI